jgi:hypothetical protein
MLQCASYRKNSRLRRQSLNHRNPAKNLISAARCCKSRAAQIRFPDSCRPQPYLRVSSGHFNGTSSPLAERERNIRGETKNNSGYSLIRTGGPSSDVVISIMAEFLSSLVTDDPETNALWVVRFTSVQFVRTPVDFSVMACCADYSFPGNVLFHIPNKN